MQFAGARGIATAVVSERQGARSSDLEKIIAQTAEETDRLFGELLRPLEISFLDERYAKHDQSITLAPRIAQAAMERERLTAKRSRQRNIPARIG